MIRLAVCILCLGLLHATDDVPYWVMSGILSVESGSRYDYGTGEERIIYVDRKVGLAGELSAYQITKGAWLQVKKKGERFQDLHTDQRYAEQIAMRYLCWLYDHSARGSWSRAVEKYNSGPSGRNKTYLTLVRQKAVPRG